METIYQCLSEEFQDTNFTSMNINSSHNILFHNGIEKNVITLTVTVYNDKHKITGKKIFKFIDDKYKISPVKKLEFITVENLESAYLASKNAIIQEIYENYEIKYNNVINKINKLQKFIDITNKQSQ